MKSEKSKKILAFVLCMVLMLTTSMSTMAEGGLIGETSSESMASQEPETQSTETTTTEETQAEEINEELSTPKETIPKETVPEVEKETVAEETISEETVSKEGVQSEATEIRHEFQDENGNVLTSVIANLPEGAFEAVTSDIVMEVKEPDAETQEHVKALIGKNLPETEKLGNYQFYEINFKVNGENQNPNKPVTITIEENNTNIQTEDVVEETKEHTNDTDKKADSSQLEKAPNKVTKDPEEVSNRIYKKNKWYVNFAIILLLIIGGYMLYTYKLKDMYVEYLLSKIEFTTSQVKGICPLTVTFSYHIPASLFEDITVMYEEANGDISERKLNENIDKINATYIYEGEAFCHLKYKDRIIKTIPVECRKTGWSVFVREERKKIFRVFPMEQAYNDSGYKFAYRKCPTRGAY